MKGGKRQGAGRPMGSTTRPQISDFITKNEVKKLVALAKKQAKIKPELLKFLLEQIFGRPAQNVNLGGQDGGPMLIKVLRYGDQDDQTPPVSG